MNRHAQRALGLGAALVAAPLVGWTSAVALNHAGLEIRPALYTGLGIAGVFLVVAGWLWWVAKVETRRPVTVAAALLSASAGLYGWLAWDPAPPPPFELELIEPDRTIARTPRELALEGTNDPAYGRAKDWPASKLEVAAGIPDATWALAHEKEIEAAWTTLAPVRGWVRRVNLHAGYDDCFTRHDSPLLAFSPLRDFSRVLSARTVLLTERKRTAEASQLVFELLSFSRRIRGGSHALVSHMIAAVLENQAVLLLEQIHEVEDVPSEIRSEILREIGSQNLSHVDWLEFGRVLRCESTVFGSMEISTASLAESTTPDGPPNWAAQCPFLLNRHDFARRYQALATELSRDAASDDAGFPGKWIQRGAREEKTLQLKNPVGRIWLGQSLPLFGKVAESLQKHQVNRARLVTRLRAME